MLTNKARGKFIYYAINLLNMCISIETDSET